MDFIIVMAIVFAAVLFTIRSFIRIYKGEGSYSCDSGCACSSKDDCRQGSEPFKTL